MKVKRHGQHGYFVGAEMVVSAPIAQRMLDMLVELEWNWPDLYPDIKCPSCFQRKRDGHAPDCKLNAAIKAATE